MPIKIIDATNFPKVNAGLRYYEGMVFRLWPTEKLTDTFQWSWYALLSIRDVFNNHSYAIGHYNAPKILFEYSEIKRFRKRKALSKMPVRKAAKKK